MKKKTHGFYSEEFKWKVVQEVLTGKLSKEEARRVYNIKSNCAVLYWMRKFSGDDNYRQGGMPLDNEIEMGNMKELSKKDKRIKELEESLNREKLRADLWQKMVEIAEEQLNVDIRKKYGAKQSIPSKNKKANK
jgi:transposase-like protein